MKDEFSNEVLAEIINEFPELEQFCYDNNGYLEIDVPANAGSRIGGLVVQIAEDKRIWFRNYHPYSGYGVDDTAELIGLIKGVLSDRMLWVIEFERESWSGTTLIKDISDLETEVGISYKILSWSGALDKDFTVDT